MKRNKYPLHKFLLETYGLMTLRQLKRWQGKRKPSRRSRRGRKLRPYGKVPKFMSSDPASPSRYEAYSWNARKVILRKKARRYQHKFARRDFRKKLNALLNEE